VNIIVHKSNRDVLITSYLFVKKRIIFARFDWYVLSQELVSYLFLCLIVIFILVCIFA